MASTSATLMVGGLATGMDTNAIIDSLVKFESIPITLINRQQAALQTQISLMSDIMSKVTALDTATRPLGDEGALGMKVSSTHTQFSAVTSTLGSPGTYDIRVTALAQVAKARSAAFTSSTDEIKAGTLTLAVRGTSYAVTIGAGDTLETVRDAVNASGAPVSAQLVNDGTSTYMTLVTQSTGFPIAGVAADALSITESYTGGTGSALGLAITQSASNAQLTIDGLPVTRESNSISDVLTGTTLQLKAVGGAAERLQLDYDTAGTVANLQKFVDAYNNLTKLIQKQLAVAPGTDRTATLAGNSALKGLQQRLASVVTAQVGGLGNVRSLVDIGVRSSPSRDGTLTIDQATLEKAMSKDARAVNTLFSHSTDGVRDLVKLVGTDYTNVTSGILNTRSTGMSSRLKDLGAQVDRLQMRVDAFRQRLVNQFTAMEKIVSGLKATGNFLAAQSSLSSSQGA